MPAKIEFKFDPNQDFQLEAIQSVVKLFEGLPRHTSEFALGGSIVPNLPNHDTLDDYWLHGNILNVQESNDPEGKLLNRSMYLELDEGLSLEGVSYDSWRYPSFTVEMETGTGKTYVYLRTIHELRQHYGFRKFVIVVPSIAIYEGVIKNFEITKPHFAALYSNETVNIIRYDGSRLSVLRNFATSTFVEILVMTIQSFRLRSNKIYRPSEQLPGDLLPYEYIQETRPILVLDEPQKDMETTRAAEALRTLHPLFALRYSATHRRTPNHIYCLTPFDAYRRGLVKKVQVDAVTERDNFNHPFLALQSISRQNGISATVKTYVDDKGLTREGSVTLKQGDDLHTKTGREEHKGGYVVEEIHAGQRYLHFGNGIRLHIDEIIGPARPEIFRVQIERTVQQHIQRQSELLKDGIKVLSLFFIDRVANYVDEEGIIKRLFDEAFEKHKGSLSHFQDREPHEVRAAYFAQRTGKDRTEFIDTSGRNQSERAAEKAAFELIMRDKERLLSFDEPVCFVFAHSALREGWDNPNVFQICTLNQTVSTMRKRQEIGRGLRLPVDQEGNRIFDDDVNVLTVVANESYQSYAETLQKEYIEEGHGNPPPKPTQVGKSTAQRNDRVFNSPHFRTFWEKLIQRADYRIHIDAPALIHACVERLNNVRFPQPVIVIERGQYVVTRFTLTFEAIRKGQARIGVRIADTRDNESEQAMYYKTRADLSKILDEPRLRGFKIKSITTADDDSMVVFQNGVELTLQESCTFQSQAGQTPRVEQAATPQHSYPVFNLIDRAARETDLTRSTINAIFRRMSDRQKQMLFTNPEGFAGLFISQLREALADHIVDHLQFVISDTSLPYDLEEAFPPQKDFPQQELVPAGDCGLYDQIQIDSGVEENFVDWRLNQDNKVIGYFKFPPSFKIDFPKLIGNYNPDWGILRRTEDERIVLQLVRETKGAEDPEQLQFPNEKRKIEAAKRHFRETGVDYRVVTDKTPGWWLPEENTLSQATSGVRNQDSVDNP